MRSFLQIALDVLSAGILPAQITPPPAEFAVANMTLTFQPDSRVSAEIGAQNLFDRNYQLTARFPEPGRTFFAGVRYTIAGRKE